MALESLVENVNNIQVMTPTGYKNFSGMSRTWHEQVVTITTADNKHVAGLKHKFLVEDGWVAAADLTNLMTLTTADFRDTPILSVTVDNAPQWLYDLIEVGGGNAYISNGVISHNCEFLSSDSLLINSLVLHRFKAAPKPVYEDMGFQFWTDKIGGRDKLYLVGIDPATGNGNDFTVIQIVEFPSLVQVGELRLNSVNIPLIYAKIKWLLKHLRQAVGGGRADVMWSFERNGVGEALVALIQNDESPDGGTYIDGVELYNERPDRFGVYTTGKSKLPSCMQLKQIIEKVAGGLVINSPHLLFELKNFISSGGSYAAKAGCTDDAVMAMCVVMKLIDRLAQYDDRAKSIVYESVSPDADMVHDVTDTFGNEPVPFSIG